MTDSRSEMVIFRSTNREIRSASGHLMPGERIGDSKILFVCEEIKACEERRRMQK